MIIVSGCPRSGTSMMMRIMEAGLGRDRILGAEFPMQERVKRELSEIQQYLYEKSGRAQVDRLREARAHQMNPNGYYEMAFSVRGIYYSPEYEDLLNDLLADVKPRVCKIVSQGLARSDPRFIDKIIYMVRDPRAVAKSQENLGRMNPMTPETAPEKDGKKVLIRSVSMFNQVTAAAAKWISAHPGIPVHIVNYDALIANPAGTLARIEAFLGEGNFSLATGLIDPTLKRSTPEDIEGEAADFAKTLFVTLLSGDFVGIEEMVWAKVEHLRANPPKPEAWHCPRLEQQVARSMCELCKAHPQTTRNLAANATRRKIEWRSEPCPYECGIDGGAGISVAESIARNHWLAASQ